MAYVYPGMDVRWQKTKYDSDRVGKLLLDSNFEATYSTKPALEAYDAVWELIGKDQALADFLHTKDPTIKTPEDVRRLR